MPRIARMQKLAVAVLVFFSAGCADVKSPFAAKSRSPRSTEPIADDPPNTYPGWAYDAPEYVRPADELTPEPKADPTAPLHFFTNEKVVMIRRPEMFDADEVPRVAVWWTENNGFHWTKAGYFGRHQPFFPFEVREDGDYGVRFVGPGHEPEIHKRPFPQRVYHVDTTPPEVTVSVSPQRAWYAPGDAVTVSWQTIDPNLAGNPVRLSLLLDFTSDGQRSRELEHDLPADGSTTFTIPPDSVDHELQFRVDALDRAGNLGMAISPGLRIVPREFGLPAEDDPNPTAMDAVIADAGSVAGPFSTDVASPHRPASLNPSELATPPDDSMTRTTPIRPVPPLPFATALARSSVAAEEMQWENLLRSVLPAKVIDGVSDAMAPRTAPASLNPDNEPSVAVNSSLELSIEPLDGPQTAAAVAGPAPVRSAARHVAESLARYGGFMVPLPATVAPDPDPAASTQVASLHPWRSLTPWWPVHEAAVWLLPRPRFGPQLQWLMEGRFLAAGVRTWPVSPPGGTQPSFVDVPDELLFDDPQIVP